MNKNNKEDKEVMKKEVMKKEVKGDGVESYVDSTLVTSHYKTVNEIKGDMTGLKNHATKLTVICSSLIIAATAATLLYTWHFGRPLEAAIGLISTDKSGAEMYRDTIRLEAEVARLRREREDMWRMVEEQRDAMLGSKEETAHLQRILNYRTETQKAFMGFVTGHTRYLDEATKCNPDRPNGFPFKDWHPHLTETLLEYALTAFRLDVLQWVTEQEDWYTIINEDLVAKIHLMLKEYASSPKEPLGAGE